MAIMTAPDRKDPRLKYLVRYMRVTKCALCAKEYETTRRALAHFTELELEAIEDLEVKEVYATDEERRGGQ